MWLALVEVHGNLKRIERETKQECDEEVDAWKEILKEPFPNYTPPVTYYEVVKRLNGSGENP